MRDHRLKILIFSDGKYGDRAYIHIKKVFPDTEFIQLPEYDATEIIDEVEFPPDTLNAIESADLLINYHRHPDISFEIASFKKPLIQAIYSGEGFLQQLRNEFGPQILMPASMCALDLREFSDSKNQSTQVFYQFAQAFGSPSYEVELVPGSDILKEVKVIRQSPCGSTIESIAMLRGKAVTPENLNAFALNVRNECREPMTYMLNRRGVADSATSNHLIPLLEALRKVRPDFFQKGGILAGYEEKLNQSANFPKI